MCEVQTLVLFCLDSEVYPCGGPVWGEPAELVEVWTLGGVGRGRGGNMEKI